MASLPGEEARHVWKPLESILSSPPWPGLPSLHLLRGRNQRKRLAIGQPALAPPPLSCFGTQESTRERGALPPPEFGALPPPPTWWRRGPLDSPCRGARGPEECARVLLPAGLALSPRLGSLRARERVRALCPPRDSHLAGRSEGLQQPPRARRLLPSRALLRLPPPRRLRGTSLGEGGGEPVSERPPGTAAACTSAPVPNTRPRGVAPLPPPRAQSLGAPTQQKGASGEPGAAGGCGKRSDRAVEN